MLRLPAALVEDISLRAGALAALSQTCSALRGVLNRPETQLRFYLAQRRRLLLSSSSSSSSSLELAPDAAVYGLLACRAKPTDAQGIVQLMLACAQTLLPAGQAGAVRHALPAAHHHGDAGKAVDLWMTALPHAEHCLLHFSAASGHLQLLKLLLPRSTAAVRLHGVLHYVKSSAFLAAAAGGHVSVLSELLAAGASHWACQLPGASLTSSALDLAALGGHMEAMQLLSQFVANPSPQFLVAAADSGSGPAMEWALQHWFAQFSAVTAFSKAHQLQMHDALKVSCQRGHVSAVRQLLAALHRTNTNNDDCCVLALTYASSTSNTDAIAAVLDSPQLPAQLARGGPKLLSKLAQAVASCIRIAILKHCRPALDLLLRSLANPSSPIAAARPLLASHMRFIFDQAGQSGNGPALQLLLLLLPEHYEALGVSALEAALSEGHAEVAASIKTLLIMQGADQGAAAAALSPEGSPGLAQASLQGAYRGACVRGDIPALQHLLLQGPGGPDDNMQLLLLRLAAGSGKEAAVRLLLAEFGGVVGPRLEANLKAVCRGAVHAGQLQLLQSLAADSLQSALLSHITSQPEALAEYLRAALLCGQVDVASWLVLLAHEQQEMELVRSTLSSLLATSRWELMNAGRNGVAVHETVFDLLKHLAARALAGGSSSSGGSAGSTCVEAGGDSLTAAASASEMSAETTVAAAAAAAGGVSEPSSLGEELLQPQLLGQLLHVSQGYPWRLLTVVELVDWWKLGGSGTHAVAEPSAEQTAVVVPQEAAVVSSAPTAEAAAGAHHQPSGAQLPALAALVPRSSSGASISSDDSATHDNNSSSSSVTSTSSTGSGGAACDVASAGKASSGGSGDGTSGGGGAAASPTTRLLPAHSLEVGSLHSDDCQQAGNWLDALVSKGSASSSVNTSPTAHTAAAAAGVGAGAGACSPTGQQPLHVLHQQHPAGSAAAAGGEGGGGSMVSTVCPLSPADPASHALHQLDLAKEWGGSWQQLTGQVAQLHMTASPRVAAHEQQQAPLHVQQQLQQQQGCVGRQPRQSFDYEQHLAQQLRHRQQQQQGVSGGAAGWRESSPGRSTVSARQLRAVLSQPASPAPRCPVHPYMRGGQQCATGQQQE